MIDTRHGGHDGRKDISMEKKIAVFVEDAIEITSSLLDYDGDLSKWKNSVYDLLRLQLSTNCIYSIGIHENRFGVFVRLVVKQGFEQSVMEFMTKRNFTNIHSNHTQAGVADRFELPGDMEYLYAE